MSKVSFRTLNPGDKAVVKFYGSSVYGNKPYEMDVIVKSTHPNKVVLDVGEIYYTLSRWRYGSSAEVAVVLSVERA